MTKQEYRQKVEEIVYEQLSKIPTYGFRAVKLIDELASLYEEVPIVLEAGKKYKIVEDVDDSGGVIKEAVLWMLDNRDKLIVKWSEDSASHPDLPDLSLGEFVWKEYLALKTKEEQK